MAFPDHPPKRKTQTHPFGLDETVQTIIVATTGSAVLLGGTELFFHFVPYPTRVVIAIVSATILLTILLSLSFIIVRHHWRTRERQWFAQGEALESALDEDDEEVAPEDIAPTRPKPEASHGESIIG